MAHAHSHGPASLGPQLTPGQTDSFILLTHLVDESSSHALNAESKTNLRSIIGPTPGVLRSDADVDPELLLVINFREPVKLRGIRLQATESKSDSDADASGPQIVKLFKGRPSAGFAECAADPPTETLTLSPAQLSGEEEIKLKFVHFQNVTSVTIFIEKNQDDTPVTFLNHLSFIGQPLEATKMSELKKIEHDH